MMTLPTGITNVQYGKYWLIAPNAKPANARGQSITMDVVVTATAMAGRGRGDRGQKFASAGARATAGGLDASG